MHRNIAHVPNEHHQRERKPAKNEKSKSTSLLLESASLMMGQTFKLNAETIRVVAKSDLPMEVWQQPMLPTDSLARVTHATSSQQQLSESNPLSLFNVVCTWSNREPPRHHPRRLKIVTSQCESMTLTGQNRTNQQIGSQNLKS